MDQKPNTGADRLSRIVDVVLELPEPARDAAVAALCVGDSALADAVRRAISPAEQGALADLLAGAGADRGSAETAPPVGPDADPGRPQSVGPYTLLARLGEGTFGEVFVAEQTRPVRRRVAVKILKPAMGSRQTIARFEAERQTLAMMDHPNIARVFDAGTTPLGLPYFVMELVNGQPITAYCDEQRLPLRDRMALMIPVCRAVHHAHQRGIIHRDIKPSNVLVTVLDGRPVAKVIDFGIAKAVGEVPPDATMLTQFRQVVGTPAYMSPEQMALSAVGVDTRSDVYSLGALLYELVCGSPPFDADTLLGAGLDEMRRVLRESDPPKPSTRVTVLDPAGRTALSGRLGTPAERVSRLLAGEVDWIVLKAIEKDRGRRYQSPTELADDIEAYLAGHGVTAGPPGGWYRARKYFRRHRVAALLTGTVVLGLAGTLAATAVGLSREAAARQVAQANERRATAGEAASNEQRLRAERAARVAGSVLNIVGFIMQGSDPRSPGGRRDVTVGEMVDRFAPIVEEGKFVEGPPLDPEVVVHLRMMLANLYLGLGRYPDGRRQAEEALKLAESMYPADAPELVTPLLNVVGASWLTRYDLPGSEVKARRAIAALARKGEVNSPQHRRAMTLLSFMLHAQRKVPEALANDLERVRLLESAGPAMKANLASALLDVGLNSAALGRADDALRFSRRGQELAIEANGPDTFAVSRSYAIVAHALAMAGRFEEAEASARKGLELSVRFLGDGHPYPKFERGTLAFMLIQRGQLDEAEALLAKNQRVIAQNFGGGDESTTDHVSLAMIWRRKGDQAKALELFRRAEAAAFGGPTPAVERDSVDIADPSAEACGIYCDLGRAPEGAAMLRPVYDRIRARLARSGDDRPDNWNLRRMASELLRAYDLIGDEPSRAAAAELCDRYPGLEPAPGFPRRP